MNETPAFPHQSRNWLVACPPPDRELGTGGDSHLALDNKEAGSPLRPPRDRNCADCVVLVACERCKCPVRLIPTKIVCASCVSALECGAPASMREYSYSQTTLLDPSHSAGRSLLSRVWQPCPRRGDRENKRMAAQRSSSRRSQGHRIRSRPDCDQKGP
jgi:hypothetical protein